MEGKIHGKQIVSNTVLRSLNGSPGTTQYLIPNSDSNIILDIITPVNSPTHSFVIGWQGQLPLDRGGLNNSEFIEGELLIANSDSVVSSGYKVNDSGFSNKDIWTADKILKGIESSTINKEKPTGEIDGVNKKFFLSFLPIEDSEHLYLNGLLQDSDDGDYTIIGDEINFLEAPLEGSKIRCSYMSMEKIKI
jgi:hypothetical protein